MEVVEEPAFQYNALVLKGWSLDIAGGVQRKVDAPRNK